MAPPAAPAFRPELRPTSLSLGVLVGLYLLHLSQLMGGWPRQLLGETLAGLIYVPVFLGSGALALVLAPRTPVPLAWRWVGTGLLLWGVGQLVYVAVQDTSGMATLADLFFLAFPVCLLAAYLRFERRWPALSGMAARLDVAALVLSLGGYLWYFLLAAQLRDPAQTPLSNVVSALYPLSDLLLLTLLLAQAWRPRGGTPRGTWLLALGMLAFIAADLGYTVLTMRDEYDGNSWPDALWPLAALLFAVAAVQATRAPLPAPPPPVRRGQLPLQLAPYAALAASFALSLNVGNPHTPAARGALACTFVVALLVAARQTLALRQLEERSAELEDSKALLHHQAHHDPLTGLGNRSHLAVLLGQALGDAWPTGLVFVDLDDFKFVNDALGHRGGDELLREVARRLQAQVQWNREAAGTACVRLGGDEFVLLLSPASAGELDDLSARVARALREPIEIDGHRLHITASLGAALSTPEVRDAETLLRQADLAMYEIKRSGKNAIATYRAGHHEQLAARRLIVENRLRGVLQRPGLSLHYQPQLERGGDRQRFEALLRWNDPELGPVSPAEFVPIAETAGLMIELDDWVIDAACRQLAIWQDTCPGRQVAVNISPPHLVRADFLDNLRATLERHGVAPQALELEVTERLLVENEEQARATLGALLDLGVDVAIDDFGVGQSSLAALIRLPISTLKIDRAFVRELAADHQDSGQAAQGQAAFKVVQAIVALGQALGLRVVAEGVETAGQAQQLWALGVDALQGYWVGRPGPPDAQQGPPATPVAAPATVLEPGPA